MLRPDGHCREIRKDHCLSLSDSAIDTPKARHGARYVSSVPHGSAGSLYSGREIQSGRKALCGRCGYSASPFLDAISARTEMHEPSPTGNGTRPGVGCRGYGQCVDQAQKEAGADRDITRRSLAATGTTGRTQVHARRTGTTLPRTRTTTSGCGAPVTHILRFAWVKALQAVHLVWSAGSVLLREILIGVWHSADYCNMERRGQHL